MSETKMEREPHAERRPHRRLGFFRTLRILKWVLILAAVGALVWFFAPKVQALLSLKTGVTVPDSLSGFLPDEKMGYTKLDFSNVILGETRGKQALVVMEQEVQVDSQISQTLANISLFEKTKIVHSFGTGVYTVDLAGLDSDAIDADIEHGLITVRIPHAELAYVNYDLAKTEFEDTQKGFLAFSDIKLTAEQKQTLDASVDAAMRERLSDPALFEKADEWALKKVREILEPLVQSVAEDFVLKVTFG